MAGTSEPQTGTVTRVQRSAVPKHTDTHSAPPNGSEPKADTALAVSLPPAWETVQSLPEVSSEFCPHNVFGARRYGERPCSP